MLFLLNGTRGDAAVMMQLLGGDAEKDVLLVGDGVFQGTPARAQKLMDAGARRIYVARDSLEERCVELSGDCEPVDYDTMVTLIMEDHEKVIRI